VSDDVENAYTALGKYRASLRPQMQGECEVCGQHIHGYATRRFCSNRCRQRAFRRKQAQAPATHQATEVDTDGASDTSGDV
jgi:endogenous inhibitor of DNA gyrase (YacG/DUF329 family)